MNERRTPNPVLVATLIRYLPVRVLEVSRVGCRLESLRPLHPGASGLLTLHRDGAVRCDDTRVARCVHRLGTGGVFDLGVELLPTRRLTHRTVRMLIRSIISRGPHDPARVVVNGVLDSRTEEVEKAASRAPPLATVTDTEPGM